MRCIRIDAEDIVPAQYGIASPVIDQLCGAVAQAGRNAGIGLDESQMVAFSAKTGEGRDALLAAVDGLVHPHVDAA